MFLINDFKAKEFANELISKQDHARFEDGMIVTWIILTWRVALLQIIFWINKGTWCTGI